MGKGIRWVQKQGSGGKSISCTEEGMGCVRKDASYLSFQFDLLLVIVRRIPFCKSCLPSMRNLSSARFLSRSVALTASSPSLPLHSHYPITCCRPHFPSSCSPGRDHGTPRYNSYSFFSGAHTGLLTADSGSI